MSISTEHVPSDFRVSTWEEAPLQKTDIRNTIFAQAFLKAFYVQKLHFYAEFPIFIIFGMTAVPIGLVEKIYEIFA